VRQSATRCALAALIACQAVGDVLIRLWKRSFPATLLASLEDVPRYEETQVAHKTQMAKDELGASQRSWLTPNRVAG
jgi:hypothetical protein